MTCRIHFARRVFLIAVAAIGVFAMSLTLATPSMAGTYSIKTCDASTNDYRSFGHDWGIAELGPAAPPDIECPNGIKFDTGQIVEYGEVAVTWFMPYSESSLRSAEFDYYGGDTSGDFRYTVRPCSYLCPELLELGPGATASAPASATVTLPEGDNHTLAIQAECVQAFCADPPEFVVKNFELEFEDDTKPTISDLETVPAGLLDPDSDVWLSGKNFALSYWVEDLGSGVMYSDVMFNYEIYQGMIPYGCANILGAAVCERSAFASKIIDVEGIADGARDLTIFAANALSGTDASYLEDYQVRIDNTPPAEPVDISLSDNVTKWGWTPEPEITMSHADATLELKNTEFSGFKHAAFDLRVGPNGAPATQVTETDPAASATLTIPHEGKWNAGIRYSDNAGNEGNRAHVPVGFDSDTPEPADPIPHGWISMTELHAGVEQTWTAPPVDADLESGICGYAYSVDDELLGIPEADANVLAPSTSSLIPSGLPEGRHHAHVRAVACNGKASETETAPINIDGTAPTPTLHGLPSSPTLDWLSNAPQVSLSATDALSGVAAIEYGFDDPDNLNLVPGSATAVPVTPGDHTLFYRAFDVAGNATELFERRIRADWNAPIAEFDPGDPASPNVLSATVRDQDSGISTAGMQIRRTDSNATPLETSWRSLGDSSAPDQVGDKGRVVTRSIPDGELPDGAYEVRITARDVAGNWSESAPPLQLRLPLRAKPVLSAAIASVGKRSKVNWAGATQDRVLRFGSRAALVGSLMDAAGKPVPGARIAWRETPEFGTPEQLKYASTDSRGEFVIRLPKGPTRRFALHFDGNLRLQPADRTATIRVRAALELKVTPRVVRSKQPFVISGRLLSREMGLPEGGKIVTIEFLRRNKWIPSMATPRVDSRGRFKVRWAPGIEVTRSTTTYIRARAQREGAWPFLTGSSKPFAVRVKR